MFNVQHLHLSLCRYGASVDIQFIPKISIFAATQFVEGQLLPGQISSLLWNHDLADVNLPTTLIFDLVWDAALSKFVLAPSLVLPATVVGTPESMSAPSR